MLEQPLPEWWDVPGGSQPLQMPLSPAVDRNHLPVPGSDWWVTLAGAEMGIFDPPPHPNSSSRCFPAAPPTWSVTDDPAFSRQPRCAQIAQTQQCSCDPGFHMSGTASNGICQGEPGHGRAAGLQGHGVTLGGTTVAQPHHPRAHSTGLCPDGSGIPPVIGRCSKLLQEAPSPPSMDG